MEQREGRVTNIQSGTVYVLLDGDPTDSIATFLALKVDVGQRVLCLQSDRKLAVIGRKVAPLPVASWRPITLTNGWTGTASYRIIDGAVEFSGVVSHATAAQGGQIAALNFGGPVLKNSGATLVLSAGTGMARVSFWSGQILMYGYFNGGTASGVVLDGVRLPLA